MSVGYLDNLVKDLQDHYDRFMDSTELFEQFNFDTSEQFVHIDEAEYMSNYFFTVQCPECGEQIRVWNKEDFNNIQ